MSERVAALLSFHATRSFGTKANLEQRQHEAADLYRSLEPDEARRLASHAIESIHTKTAGDSEQILRCLACLRPGSLNDHYESLVDHGIFYPAVIYHGASEAIAGRLSELLTPENADHLLCTLAWIGGITVQEAFAAWRERPPEWAAGLYIPPHLYSRQAGWDLSADGGRREFLKPACLPLILPGESEAVSSAARFVEDGEGPCGWCGRPLTIMLDLDGGSTELSGLGLAPGRLRIATCEVCCCYGPVLTNLDVDGKAVWHELNVTPAYLPKASEEWVKLPRRCLTLGPRLRNPIESADWLVPGVHFSQLGGYPTWIQDAEYPECPGCRQPMPFVAQLSNEDYEEYGEGIYYMFACGPCGVASTTYQQT